MALNMLGLGFAFSAVDKGLGKILKGTNDGFFKLGQTFETAAELAGHFTSRGMNLTTEFEATVTQMNTAAKRFGAQTHLVGKTVDEMAKSNKSFAQEATSLGLALNMGSAQAGEAIVAFSQFDKTLKDVTGIQSASQLAKFSAVFNISSQEMANNVEALNGLFKSNPQAQKEFIGAVFKSGQAMDDVTGSFQLMPAVLEEIRRAQAIGMKDTDQFGKQIFALAAHMRTSLGLSAKEARDFSVGLGQSLLGAQEALQGLAAGTESDLDEFTKGLAINTGDVREAFKMMQSGPAGFVNGLVSMAKAAEKSGKSTDQAFSFLAAHLRGSLGEMAKTVIQAMKDKGPDAVKTMVDTMQGATVDLGHLSDKLHTTGRTLAESFQLMEGSFQAQLRRRSVEKAGNFVDRMGKNFRDATKQIDHLRREIPLLDSVLTTLTDVSVMGPVALLPKEFQGTAVAVGNVVSMLGPAVAQLGQFTNLAKALVNPVNLVVAALGAVYILYEKNKRDVTATTREVTGYVTQALNFIQDLIHGNVVNAEKIEKSGAGRVFSDIWKILKGTWENTKPQFLAIGKEVGRYFSDIFNGFMSKFTGEGAPDSEAARYGAAFGNFVQRSLEKGIDILEKILPPLINRLLKVAVRLWDNFSKEHPWESRLVAGYFGGKLAGEVGEGFGLPKFITAPLGALTGAGTSAALFEGAGSELDAARARDAQRFRESGGGRQLVRSGGAESTAALNPSQGDALMSMAEDASTQTELLQSLPERTAEAIARKLPAGTALSRGSGRKPRGGATYDAGTLVAGTAGASE